MLAPSFGKNGSPFQLSPDPDFYFDSHGHHRALAALRRGLSEASGFTVISGDIGAGKTTAVRAVLRELKPQYFVVAQIVSTQLDPEELLRAISIGFGLSSAPEGPLALAASLRRFMTELRARGQRAVLVVDEAQNLRSDAFDQLVGLALRGAPPGCGMQICLVGQPELQAMISSPDLSAVREQVCVSCHLGPLEREETGPYVAHRLRKVGWKGGQAFDVDAFDEIYRWTGGIARRINMLCSRAIVSRAAGDERLIDAASVALVAREERNEMGETGPEPPLLLPTTRHAPRAARSPRRPVLFLVASLADHVKAAALMAAMAERIPSLTIKLVRVHDDEALALSVLLFDGLDLEHGLITLGCAESAKEARRAELERKLKDVVDKVSPKAVVVFDDGEEVIGCATVARSMGLTVVHVGNGLPAEPAGTSGVGGRKAVGASADWWYPTFDQASRALALKGVPAAGIHCVGSLLVDAVQMALRISRDPMRNGAIHRMVVPLSSEDGRYALVVIEEPKHVADRHRVVALLAFLRRISRSIALVLLMRPHAEREFDEHRLPREIFDERMCYLRGQEYANQVELLRHAACVMTDSPDVREEASALHTPCLAIGTRARSTLPGAGRIASSEGEASASAWAVWPYGAHRDLLGGQGVPACTRIAEHLGARLKHPVAPPFIL